MSTNEADNLRPKHASLQLIILFIIINFSINLTQAHETPGHLAEIGIEL